MQTFTKDTDWLKKLTRDELQHCIIYGLTDIRKLEASFKTQGKYYLEDNQMPCWQCYTIAWKFGFTYFFRKDDGEKAKG